MNQNSASVNPSDVGTVVENVVDEVVPQSILQKIDKFSNTSVGSIVMTALFVIIVALITLVIIRLINGFFRKTSKKMIAAGNPSVTAFSYLRYLALAIIYFAAINIVVSNIPFLETSMNRLFAAGGILAVVLGFASQQAMGSLISGLMILTFKPFAIGDWVTVVSNNVAGTVEDITLRHTILRTIENKRTIVPNDIMNSAIIENANHTDTKLCLILDICIAHETNISAMMKIMQEEIMHHKDFFDNRTAQEKLAGIEPVIIRVQELTDTAVMLRAFLWARDSGAAYPMRSDVIKSIKERCDLEGISLSYPHLIIKEK